MVYKISVVIPCYNAELTLKNCIESLINQTFGFENIELILYDDCSSDSTREIIKDYADKFENIVPIYSDMNSGFPGTGRNKGVEVASSEYVMFMDNDDEYDPHMCEKLYTIMIDEKVDLVCCEKIAIDEHSEMKGTTPCTFKENEKGQIVITGDAVILFKNVALWNKIYKTEIISKNNIKFLEDTYADDFAFAICYFLKSKKIIYLKDYYGYIWNIRSDSMSHNVKPKDISDLIVGYLYIYDALKKENKEKFMDNIIKNHIRGMLIQCSHLKVDNHEFKEVLNEILIFEKKINFSTKLDGKVYEIINRLIMNKKFNLAILCLKSMDKVRSTSIIRKMYRFYVS